MSIEATLAERGKRYGEFAPKATTIQMIKDAMRDSPSWPHLSDAQKESLELIATKLGRILHGDPDYADNWIDIAGYSKLVADTLKP